jgi:hypothetical protein
MGNIIPELTEKEHAIVNGIEVKKVVNVDSNGNLVGSDMAQKVTVVDTITYIGIAAPGTAQNVAKWQCKKIDTSVAGTTVITWADGNASFDNIVTDLTALTYT